MAPLISICIPAYKRVAYLQRLLESIAAQTFSGFEIILTDDSPDDSVSNLIKNYSSLNIKYFKNEVALGTPANWNCGIAKASGEWIKLMHDDDWFASPHSLQQFANAANKNYKFIFSSYYNCFEDTGKIQQQALPFYWRHRIITNPVTLLAHNVIGPPSVTLLHRSIAATYDERMQWRVDIDFYIRILLSEKKFLNIKQPLINVGINSTQVTKSSFELPKVELPEGYLLLEKYGVKALRNIYVYDAWWRLLRNMKIYNEHTLRKYVNVAWPAVIVALCGHLYKTKTLTKTKVLSKCCMAVSYLLNLQKLI